jgi:hypothetical protein
MNEATIIMLLNCYGLTPTQHIIHDAMLTMVVVVYVYVCVSQIKAIHAIMSKTNKEERHAVGVLDSGPDV